MMPEVDGAAVDGGLYVFGDDGGSISSFVLAQSEETTPPRVYLLPLPYLAIKSRPGGVPKKIRDLVVNSQ